MRKMSLLLFILSIFTSCTTLPRTSGELRQGTTAWGLTKTESHVIKRQYSLTLSDIKKNAMKCLNFSYSQSSYYGNTYMAQGTKVYNPKVVNTGPGKAEMTMQWERLPRNNHDPEGGFYIFLADIEKISRHKTRLTMHGSTFTTWDPIFSAVKGWGEGKDVACPETP